MAKIKKRKILDFQCKKLSLTHRSLDNIKNLSIVLKKK